MLSRETYNALHNKMPYHTDWRNPHNFLELAKQGIFVPFADAFEYMGRGMLVIGSSGSGKTSIVGRFVRYNNRHSKRLAEDTSTNEFDGKKTYVYPTGRAYSVNLQQAIDGSEKYQLATIFHLLRDKGEIIEGDLEEAIRQMFDPALTGLQVVNEVLEITYAAYRTIPIVKLPCYSTPDARYRRLKELVINLMPRF